jgi:hypothetical protein
VQLHVVILGSGHRKLTFCQYGGSSTKSASNRRATRAGMPPAGPVCSSKLG